MPRACRGRAEARLPSKAEVWEIDPAEELGRVMPVIERLHSAEPSVVISIDTTKAAVANEALRAGASIVNDISAFRFDLRWLRRLHATNATVSDAYAGNARDDAARSAVRRRCGGDQGLAQRSGRYRTGPGIEQIIIDPGIGFGKNLSTTLRS